MKIILSPPPGFLSLPPSLVHEVLKVGLHFIFFFLCPASLFGEALKAVSHWIMVLPSAEGKALSSCGYWAARQAFWATEADASKAGNASFLLEKVIIWEGEEPQRVGLAQGWFGQLGNSPSDSSAVLTQLCPRYRTSSRTELCSQAHREVNRYSVVCLKVWIWLCDPSQ